MTDKKPCGAENITWDLSDLYIAPDDPQIEKDLNDADHGAKKLMEQYYSRIADLSDEELFDMLRKYEAVLDKAWKAGTYAYLYWSTNAEDSVRGALLQRTTERNSRLSQKLLFLELEWANTSQEKALVLIESPKLKPYRHWLILTRRYKPYLLSEAEEKILSEKSINGRKAWARFFSEVHGAARYEWQGEMIPQQSILNKLHDPDRDTRKLAASSFTTGLQGLKRTTTYIFNCILADKASDDRLRKYPTWLSARNLDNQVGDDTVEALINAVVSRYDIVARYYNLKRKILGLDELFDYDRYAPLPATDRKYSWNDARRLVHSAFSNFHQDLGSIVEEFFTKQWIDAAVVPGKRGGAYSHGAVPSVHPYIFLNYEGTARDMMTLAHEMGHGVHQVLSRCQGILLADTPLTTAETASVFGEMLVFKDALSKEKDPRIRLSMLVGKIEDSLATVFRQIAMNRFEEEIHRVRRKEGEIATERFGEIWQTTQESMFQGSVTLNDNYRLWWSYIPHFIHSPGYVYAYAFGELLVLALYAEYMRSRGSFPALYLEMLKAGGSIWPHELLKPFGVDLKDPQFWNRGIELLENLVIEAEDLAGEAGF